MGIKYYYSAPQQIRRGYFLADAIGNHLYTFDNSTFVRNLPRVTICSILEENTLSFGYTTCASKDQYVKKLGQRIAFARALKKPYKTVKIDNMKEIHSISEEIVQEIFDSETKRLYQ